MNTERSAPGTVVPTAVISSVMLALPASEPEAVNCALVACTDRLPAAIVRRHPKHAAHVDVDRQSRAGRCGAHQRHDLVGRPVAFNCNGGA